MSEPKWTPGPWKETVRGTPEYRVKSLIRGGFRIEQAHGHAPIAKTYGGLSEQEMANAHLIAAAPQLYEALDAIAALDDGDQRFVWKHPEEFERAHAALAKARGESQ